MQDSARVSPLRLMRSASLPMLAHSLRLVPHRNEWRSHIAGGRDGSTLFCSADPSVARRLKTSWPWHIYRRIRNGSSSARSCPPTLYARLKLHSVPALLNLATSPRLRIAGTWGSIKETIPDQGQTDCLLENESAGSYFGDTCSLWRRRVLDEDQFDYNNT
jgi:hypothetical protein